jgi:hypothetical protein
MNAQPMEPLALAGFDATISRREGGLSLSLRGNGDMTVSPTLGRYLKEVDALCQRERVKTLDVRLIDLYFLSSSCFQALASWVLSIASRPAETRYVVRFETNGAHTWQKRSLEAIRRVAPTTTIVV